MSKDNSPSGYLYTYGERLHHLGIPTLELRRLRSDLSYMVLQNYLRLC